MARANEETILAVKLALAYHAMLPGCAENGVNAIKIADDAATLKSMARSLHRIHESECNDNLPDAQVTRRIERRSHLRVAISTLALEYGLTVSWNGDPRGYAVKLHFPDGRGNTWGGDSEGWGI